jgi:8-oxo-dGTP pyrophosphatase MutT (NUDIX family)
LQTFLPQILDQYKQLEASAWRPNQAQIDLSWQAQLSSLNAQESAFQTWLDLRRAEKAQQSLQTQLTQLQTEKDLTQTQHSRHPQILTQTQDLPEQQASRSKEVLSTQSSAEEPQNPWTILSSAQTYDNPWIQVTEHQVLTPGGNPGIYGTVHCKRFATGIIPLDPEGYTWLVGQYRFPLHQYSWEIPEGGGSLQDNPLTIAQRELQEETGLTANRWRKILDLALSNCIMDEIGAVFLAQDLHYGESDPDDTEVLQIKRIPFSEALNWVEQGTITDAISVAGILKVQLMLLRGEIQF